MTRDGLLGSGHERWAWGYVSVTLRARCLRLAEVRGVMRWLELLRKSGCDALLQVVVFRLLGSASVMGMVRLR